MTLEKNNIHQNHFFKSMDVFKHQSKSPSKLYCIYIYIHIIVIIIIIIINCHYYLLSLLITIIAITIWLLKIAMENDHV